MDLRKRYKRTMTAVGGALLLWAAFFNLFQVILNVLKNSLSATLNAVTLEIVLLILYGASYLCAFMLPALFFRLFVGRNNAEDMRLQVELRGDSFAWIFGGIACCFAFSLLNGIFMNLFSVPETDGIIKEAFDFMPDYSIILQFIVLALVPAFCEEFLFRGVILSNLMPYGKGLAIIVSSVLFGLMHGNFYQFLYTTAAGLVLGYIYVLTDSIWCSVLMHLINNSLSVLQLAIYGRFADEMATVVWMIVEGIVFILGLVSIVYLVLKHGKRRSPEKYGELGSTRELAPGEMVKGALNPIIIVFAVYSVAEAVARLIPESI